QCSDAVGRSRGRSASHPGTGPAARARVRAPARVRGRAGHRVRGGHRRRTAYAAAHVASGGDSVAGILLGIWGLGSAVSGVYFGRRRLSMALNRQLSWLLAAVALSFTVYAAMPTVVALGVALFAGGAMIAPALIVATMLIGRITPPSMHTEAYTWAT